jgi:DivIVA domain-containing protein
MALTPEDVVNKRFQPTKFREGYDQDEVDDFLDEVVVELRRLNQENEELRQRLVQGESRIAELQRSAAQAPEPAPVAAAPAYVEPAPVAAAPAPAPAIAPAPAYVPASDPNEVTNNTNNLLQLARKLHEEHVREGIEKRDALIAEGHATAARVVSEAEEATRTKISALDHERTALEGRIEELRDFEREYRSKLKSYIESQLHELDSSDLTSASSSPTAAQSPSYDSSSFNSAASTPPSFQGFGGN